MMKRGAIWIASEKGVLTGKPLPMLILQNRLSLLRHSTITICLISAALTGYGLYLVSLMLSPTNGLREPSEVQVDRIFSMGREAFDGYVGLLAPSDIERIEEALRRWLEI